MRLQALLVATIMFLLTHASASAAECMEGDYCVYEATSLLTYDGHLINGQFVECNKRSFEPKPAPADLRKSEGTCGDSGGPGDQSVAVAVRKDAGKVYATIIIGPEGSVGKMYVLPAKEFEKVVPDYSGKLVFNLDPTQSAKITAYASELHGPKVLN